MKLSFIYFGGHLFSFLYFLYSHFVFAKGKEAKTKFPHKNFTKVMQLLTYFHCFKNELLKMARDWTHWLALFLAGMTKDDFFSTFFRIITFQRQYFVIAILSSDSQICLTIFTSFMNTINGPLWDFRIQNYGQNHRQGIWTLQWLSFSFSSLSCSLSTKKLL